MNIVPDQSKKPLNIIAKKKQMKPFYLPDTQVMINLEKVVAFGMFRTYRDTEKKFPVTVPMVKFQNIVKGHPYSIEITESELQTLNDSILDLIK